VLLSLPVRYRLFNLIYENIFLLFRTSDIPVFADHF